MQRPFSAFLALVGSVTLVFVATTWNHGVTAVHAQAGCGVATLTGNYGVVLTGAEAPAHSVKGMNNVPVAAVGGLDSMERGISPLRIPSSPTDWPAPQTTSAPTR